MGIIRLAFKTTAPQSTTAPKKYYANNLIGVISVFSARKISGIINFVFSSTASAYVNDYIHVEELASVHFLAF